MNKPIAEGKEVFLNCKDCLRGNLIAPAVCLGCDITFLICQTHWERFSSCSKECRLPHRKKLKELLKGYISLKKPYVPRRRSATSSSEGLSSRRKIKKLGGKR